MRLHTNFHGHRLKKRHFLHFLKKNEAFVTYILGFGSSFPQPDSRIRKKKSVTGSTPTEPPPDVTDTVMGTPKCPYVGWYKNDHLLFGNVRTLDETRRRRTHARQSWS